MDISPWMDASAGSIYCADRNPLPAGDPHIVYPGRKEICSSIRWEVVRKGMEDFEYLHLLEEAVSGAAGKGGGGPVAAAKKVLARVRSEIAPDPLGHTRDERALLAVREEVGALLSKVAREN